MLRRRQRIFSARLQTQKLDLAVVFEQDFVLTFSRTLLFSQRFFLIGKSLPGKARSSVSLDEIVKLPLVLPGVYSERRRIIDRAFAEGKPRSDCCCGGGQSFK